jgi:N-acetylglucosaminyl-diphospho-decaprenol L-rhamnosyltransferase
MAADARVLAICVNWNGRGVLGGALEALLGGDLIPSQTVVVDNASTDGSVDRLPAGVELIRLPQNVGYGAAINRIWEQTRTGARPAPDYYLLLNNDVFVTRETLRRLVAFAAGAGPGIYGPKILNRRDPQRLDMAWGALTWTHVLARFVGKGAPGDRWTGPRRVELLQGSILLMDAVVVDAVGLFDERFFMYHEEVDYLYRAAGKGYAAYFCPDAEALHEGAHSTRGTPELKIYWTRRNTVYFLRKHRATAWRWFRFFVTLAASLGYNLVLLRWRRAATIVRGIRDGFAMGVEKH